MSSVDVEHFKAVLPLPSLLHKIGLGKFAKNSCRSPFREDKKPSWGIFKRDGKWFWKDHGTGDGGDEMTLLARWKGLDEKRDFPQLVKLYAELAGVSLNGEQRQPSKAKSSRDESNSFAWATCVAAFGSVDFQRLSDWRGYSPAFCAWLKAESQIGLYGRSWALPVHGENGAVIGTHYRVERGSGEKPDWFYFPKGIAVRPLLFGDPKRAAHVFLLESPWDAFAVMDKLGWHKPNGIPDTAVVITRGAANGKMVAGMFTPKTTVYAFKQNDESKDGKNAADQWLAGLCAYAGCKVLHVMTPAQFKDLNQWTQAGATGADIMAATEDAKLIHEPVVFREESGAGENVENGEGSRQRVGPDPFSTFSTGGYALDQAIFPNASWLARYMDFARQREESADSYLLGSILSVVAAALARRVRFPWGEGYIYPNLFVMLAGKPGDRKSSAINLAENIARRVLDKAIFLPDSLSVEALFDEYDVGRGGVPDKLLIADDANPFLGLLQKSNYGERVGELLLRLFDCKGLAESFRRNKSGEESTSRRYIDETSTSIVLGATFNVCQFQGQQIRSGLQRRFNYYLAERHGRFLAVPAKSEQSSLLRVTERLAEIVSLPNTECRFTPEAAELWAHFQQENRRQLEATSINQEPQLARLNGQPVHVLKLGIVFQATLWAENQSKPFAGEIELTTLQRAIEHSRHCIAAAQALDAIGNRAAIQADADVLLAKIQTDFGNRQQNGVIMLTRTDLTSAYASHSERRGTLKPDDLYLRLIPDLIRRRKAKEQPRPGKQSAFAFRMEDA